MLDTLADVAQELNSRYGEIRIFLKKGEKSKTFIAILKSLFIECGERFGFEDFSSFKSSILQVKNNIRRTRKRAQKNLELRFGINQDFAIEPKKKTTTSGFRKHFRRPKEGDGEVYTEWQVEFYGLNADSY